MELKDYLSFDPLQAAEDVTGQSYKKDKDTENLGFALAIAHNQAKDKALLEAKDTSYSSKIDYYLSVIKDLGFEQALIIPFPSSSSKTAMDEQHVWAHRENGVVLSFDTYGGYINGGIMSYCWRPKEGLGTFPRVTSSGAYESESEPKWRTDLKYVEGERPADLFWSGYHDCREAIRYHFNNLSENGTFIPKWPSVVAGKKKSGFYLTNYADWKVLNRDKMSWEETTRRLNDLFDLKASALPKWVQEIIGVDYANIPENRA